MRITKLLLGVFIAIAFFFACSESTVTEDLEVDYNYEYFPLEIGKYVTYQMDSTVYDPNGTELVYNSTNFVREELVDTFRDNQGRLSYVLERFEKANESDPWVIKDVWYATRGRFQAEVVEENLRLVKLVFPARLGVTWDATDFIDKEQSIVVAGETIAMFKNWSSEILSFEKAEAIGTLSFSDVMVIEHADEENLIEKRFSMEKYAPEVGMVYRYVEILDTQCIEDCGGLTWHEKAEKGFILEQKVIDYN